MNFDLERRTLLFTKKIVVLSKSLMRDIVDKELLRQLIRSSTSIGANYREAHDALGTKDFLFRLKIARKEAKETIYWLELMLEIHPDESNLREFIQESTELKNILSAIINNAKKRSI